jgi:hypothetical protein
MLIFPSITSLETVRLAPHAAIAHLHFAASAIETARAPARERARLTTTTS